MFEPRVLAVQTGLIVLASPQSCLLFPFLLQMGENDSSFWEMNLVAEESLTNACQASVSPRRIIPTNLFLGLSTSPMIPSKLITESTSFCS